MKRMLLAVWMFSFMLIQCTGALAESGSVHTAVNGTLQLSADRLQPDQTIPLDGAWEFYWQQLLEPEDLHTRSSVRPSYIQVPGEWKNVQTQDQPLSNQGYGTYRLVIQLNESDRNQPKSLYMPSVATAYKLWVNGVPLAENGKVGKSPAEMVPKNYPKVVAIPPGSSQIEVVIQVSNFVQRKGGLWQSIRFGLAEPIQLQREKQLVYESFIAACLLIMGLYHLGLFIVRRSLNNKSALFFGLLSITIAIRTMLLGGTIAVRFFPQLDWFLTVKVEYWTAMFGVAFLFLFVEDQYPHEVKRVFRYPILAGSLVGSMWILLTSPLTFTSSLLLYQVFILVSIAIILGIYLAAAIQKREGSVLNGIGVCVFFLSCLNDTLYYLSLGTYENLVPLGLLVFLLTQMVNLSFKFARSFIHVQKLSTELQEINSTLEKKVRDRTIELEQSNKDLEKINDELSTMEKSRRALLSNISHELGTPLTSIQGFIKAMIDGVVQNDDPKYLHLIYDKTMYLNRIIYDLYELTKMETRHLSFYFKPVSLLWFLEQFYKKHIDELEKKGIAFHFQNKLALGPGWQVMANIDSTRMEQVFVNLLTNAAKFTPEGGEIRLVMEASRDSSSNDTVSISIIDTGVGIDEEDLPFIFDRFYKGTESRIRGGEGVGLGLAISKEIVQCHQGRIEVFSQLNQGSEFRITLPVTYGDNNEIGEVS